MKKRLSVLLVLCLLLSVCVAPVALAAGVTVLSTQNLAVDGKTIPCEKYNIDGSNYFKLRDMAYLLNGTGSQFAVGWDAASSTVSITTGQPYTPNGTELKLDGGDKSATSVPSSQTIKIDGVVVSNLSVYNIGGNNYFKLRDLGNALGFEVGYDAATFTATVTTAKEMVWLPVKETCVDVEADGEVSYYGSYVMTYTYDTQGRQIQRNQMYGTGNGTEGSVFTTTYSGNTETVVYEDIYQGEKNLFETIVRTYGEDGKLLSTKTTGLGRVITFTYDDKGNAITKIFESTTAISITNYTNTYDTYGNLTSITEYENGKLVFASYYTYMYDTQGKPIAMTESGDYSGAYTYTYNADGQLMMCRYVNEYTSSTTVNTYDVHGNIVKSVSTRYDLDTGAVTSTATTTIEYAQFPKAN